METLYPVSGGSAKKPPTSKTKLKEVREKPKAQEKADRQMQELESLHDRNGVRSSIQLPEGRRIKLDNGELNKTVGKEKLKATFDVEFSEFDTGKDLDWGITDLAPLSDDDLPSTRDILQQRSRKQAQRAKVSSDSMYDDPEMDELIRNMPSPSHDEGLPSPLQNEELEDSMQILSPPQYTYDKKRQLEDSYDDNRSSDALQRDAQSTPAKRRKVCFRRDSARNAQRNLFKCVCYCRQ